MGASFLTKRVVDAESDTVVRLQIWDTAGQERFRYVVLIFVWGERTGDGGWEVRGVDVRMAYGWIRIAMSKDQRNTY